jgi:hypothetical protein
MIKVLLWYICICVYDIYNIYDVYVYVCIYMYIYIHIYDVLVIIFLFITFSHLSKDLFPLSQRIIPSALHFFFSFFFCVTQPSGFHWGCLQECGWRVISSWAFCQWLTNKETPFPSVGWSFKPWLLFPTYFMVFPHWWGTPKLRFMSLEHQNISAHKLENSFSLIFKPNHNWWPHDPRPSF